MMVAVSSSMTIFRSKTRMKELLRDNYRKRNVTLVLLIMVPYYVLLLTSTGISNYNYWQTFGILIVFFVFRIILTKIVVWLTGKTEVVNNVYKLSQVVFLLIVVFSLFLFLFKEFIPSFPQNLSVIYLSLVSVLLLMIFFVNERDIFLNSGFSHFFWFLYLCALEILPICVVVNTIAF